MELGYLIPIPELWFNLKAYIRLVGTFSDLDCVSDIG